MEGLTALFAGLLVSLRGLAPDVCPGGWPWAVTALGVAVGLLPAVGAVFVALVRKRIGSRYGVAESTVLIGTGLLMAGLMPLVAFSVTGRLFAQVAAGGDVPVLSGADLEELGSDACFEVIGTQAEYLGQGSVATAFDTATPLRFGYALVLLAAVPIVTAMFVAGQARLALRRGPSWPSKFFWLPVLALAFLTAGVPYGTAGQMWAGAAAGALLGIVVVLLAGVPSRETVRRSLAGAGARRAPEPHRAAAAPDRRSTPEPHRPPESRRAAAAPDRRPTPEPHRPPVNRAGPRPATPRPPTPATARPRPAPTPTLVAPAPSFPVAGPVPPGGAPRFRLIRRLGSGGFGRVWLAHDTRLNIQVALKAAHAPDAETEQRIRREAEALAAVAHPHCVRIHDLVPAAGDPGLADLGGMVIVMGYVDGMPLGEMVRSRGLLDDVAAARVWVNLAGALDAAHQRGVMHRDVKPGNVVVDTEGLAHLIDFGIARKTGDATMTQAGFVLGTPDFLAPEIACGERATPASDSWQLAATVSYALTGRPPRGEHPDAVSGLRAAAAGAPLSHLPRRSAHLALLQAALDTDPGRRPPLPAVQSALSDWLRRTGARPDGPVTAGTQVL